ncbi:hypothetical protein K1719_035845 [Acacia pycnantha]|nr:hypothetical protein K1719_035845 [Acacia pycnantha]
MALAGKLEDEVEVQAPASKRLAHPGSDNVKNWTFTLGGKVVSCKEHFEEIDHANKTLTWCPCQMDFEYEKLRPDVPPPQAYLDFITKVTKDVDAHVIKA